MSKEHHISQVEKKVKQPEVGDVWENNNTKKTIYVLGIYKTSWGEYVCWCSYWEKELELINENVGKKLFLQNYAYLGKSKVSIKELFDVD